MTKRLFKSQINIIISNIINSDISTDEYYLI